VSIERGEIPLERERRGSLWMIQTGQDPWERETAGSRNAGWKTAEWNRASKDVDSKLVE